MNKNLNNIRNTYVWNVRLVFGNQKFRQFCTQHVFTILVLFESVTKTKKIIFKNSIFSFLKNRIIEDILFLRYKRNPSSSYYCDSRTKGNMAYTTDIYIINF